MIYNNVSIFQCAENDFEITPQHYSLYLDPRQRDKELKISWVREDIKNTHEISDIVGKGKQGHASKHIN